MKDTTKNITGYKETEEPRNSLSYKDPHTLVLCASYYRNG